MDSVSLTPATSLSFLPSLEDGVLLVFYIIAAIYVVFSAVFYYHWQQYGTNAKVTWITYVTYLATTVSLFITLAIVTLAI